MGCQYAAATVSRAHAHEHETRYASLSAAIGGCRALSDVLETKEVQKENKRTWR